MPDQIFLPSPTASGIAARRELPPRAGRGERARHVGHERPAGLGAERLDGAHQAATALERPGEGRRPRDCRVEGRPGVRPMQVLAPRRRDLAEGAAQPASAVIGTDSSDVLTSPTAIGTFSPSSSAKNPNSSFTSSTGLSRSSAVVFIVPSEPVISLMSVSVSAITSSRRLDRRGKPAALPAGVADGLLEGLNLGDRRLHRGRRFLLGELPANQGRPAARYR